MKAETYFVSRILGDEFCNGNKGWICKPIPEWLFYFVLILILGYVAYEYYNEWKSKKNE